MSDVLIETSYDCAYCNARNTATVDRTGGLRQRYTEDCETCCRPNVLHVEIDPEDESMARIEAIAESDVG